MAAHNVAAIDASGRLGLKSSKIRLMPVTVLSDLEALC
jgi:hypothetical protein